MIVTVGDTTIFVTPHREDLFTDLRPQLLDGSLVYELGFVGSVGDTIITAVYGYSALTKG